MRQAAFASVCGLKNSAATGDAAMISTALFIILLAIPTGLSLLALAQSVSDGREVRVPARSRKGCAGVSRISRNEPATRLSADNCEND
jgi:hypothetical protein